MNDSAIPLCIDFDGTLTSSSMRLEQMLQEAKQSPGHFFRLLRSSFGRAAFAPEVSERSNIDIASMALRPDLVAWLEQERQSGRRLVLVLAGDQPTADRVVASLPFFEDCVLVGKDGASNAQRKRRSLIARYGERGFDYVGSDKADEIVWKSARCAVVVGDPSLAKRIGRVSDVVHVFPTTRPTLMNWLKAIRLHQWVKNSLVFLPVLLAHTVFTAHLISDLLLAFVGFGLCASSVYLTNDLLDLAADRAHPRKRRRPLAAGLITPRAGIWASICLLVAGALIALQVGPGFAATLACYYVLTCAYSLRLKRIALLDVMTLATLYTIRIIAGAVATKVELSFWLLAFSVFIFMSLALVKRYTELEATQRPDGPSGSGRGYRPEDMPVIMSLGTAAGFAAIVVIALYINSPESQAIYHHHRPLWLICPLMLAWISRVWMLAARGRLHDDPVVFAVRDRISLFTLGIIVLSVLISI